MAKEDRAEKQAVSTPARRAQARQRAAPRRPAGRRGWTDAPARWIVALVIGLGLARVALDVEWVRAQSRNDAKSYTFVVSSVAIDKSGETRVTGGFQPGGRYQATNYTLRALIAAAYLRPQINPDFLIAGGPAWIDSAHFDVDAKAAGEFPPGPDGPAAPRRVMLQNLLADRFKLAVHNESRSRSVYALVMARPDDRMGPQLRPSVADCTPVPPAGGAPSAPPPAVCSIRVGPGSIHALGMTMAQLLNLLPRFVDRVVQDRSGLSGRFDLDLEWTPAAGEWMAPPIAGAEAPPRDGPSLFTALQEQLGLKLNSTTGAVDVLVVDRAALPAED